jgi:hypothetical protein
MIFLVIWHNFASTVKLFKHYVSGKGIHACCTGTIYVENPETIKSKKVRSHSIHKNLVSQVDLAALQMSTQNGVHHKIYPLQMCKSILNTISGSFPVLTKLLHSITT